MDEERVVRTARDKSPYGRREQANLPIKQLEEEDNEFSSNMAIKVSQDA